MLAGRASSMFARCLLDRVNGILVAPLADNLTHRPTLDVPFHCADLTVDAEVYLSQWTRFFPKRSNKIFRT